MDQPYLFRLLKVLAFLSLMFISSWATVESAHRLLTGWPVPFLWILSLVFFSLAAWGSDLIITSFDQSIRVNGRFYKLLGGIILLICFWIGIILPTNTHTFFYKSIIEQTAIEEIEIPLIPVLAAMESEGISLDKNALKEISGELEKDILKVDAEIQALAGKAFTMYRYNLQYNSTVFEWLGMR